MLASENVNGLPADLLWQGIYTARCSGGSGQGLEQILPSGRTKFYGYGRQALAAGLLTAGVRKGDHVLLPAFLCREVLASLAFIGAEPVFYQVDESLGVDARTLPHLKTDKVRAAMAVNYFGFPQPLGLLREWCQNHDAVLIEDNAHGFLSADGEELLGRRSEIGIFSLRKTLFLPNGAVLVDNRPGETHEETLMFHGTPRRAERRYRAKAWLKRWMRLGGTRSACTAVATLRLVRLLATGSAIPQPALDGEERVPQESYSLLSTDLLSRCDFDAERKRRRALFQQCAELFAGVADVRPVFDGLPAGVVPQGFPFLFAGKDPAAFIKQWWRRGIPIVSWPDRLPASVIPSAPFYYNRVMLAQFLW